MTGARRRRWAPGRALVLAGVAAALIGLCVGSLAWHAVRVTGAVIIGRAAPAGWPPAGWRAVQCDVGQGDALVVRSGVDRAVLIDAGPDAALVDACLSRLGVHHLDLVVITHYHSDHAAGLAGALHRRSAGEVLVSPLGRPAAAARGVREEAQRARAPLVRAWAGLHGVAGNAEWPVRWAVLWPPVPPTVAGTPGPADVPAPVVEDGDSLDGSAANDASLVIAVRAGPLGLVALGDLETAAQGLLARQIVISSPVDVVKVAHHGSARQDPGLYARLRPRIALIGVGRHNDYGHPVPSTVAMLRSDGILVLRTDTEGDAAVVTVRPAGLAVATAGPRPP